MTTKADNLAWGGDTDKDGQYQCQDCGGTYQPGQLPVPASDKECPTCRQNRVNETLRYIKELLNDSGDTWEKPAR